MADVQPLRALHYALEKTGGLQPVVAPPYDVIYTDGRAALLEQSPYNVVAIDLPVSGNGVDPYEHAAAMLTRWRAEGAVVQEEQPTLWPIEQD